MADLSMLPAYCREQAQIRAHRRAAQLADGLLLALRINPCGQELIVWLTSVGARNNRDALVAWVLGQLPDVSLEVKGTEVFALMERLTRQLNQIAEAVNHACN